MKAEIDVDRGLRDADPGDMQDARGAALDEALAELMAEILATDPMSASQRCRWHGRQTR
jgi:hypothetical protein